MSTATVELAAGTYTLDKIHSEVGFGVKHLGVSNFRGGFSDYDAQLEVAGDGTLSLTGSVDVTSVQVKEPNLAGHLQAPDFLDSQQFPRIKFASTSLTVGDGGEAVLTGELSLKDVTREVEARGTVSYVAAGMDGNPRIGIDVSTVINRQDYNVSFSAQLPSGEEVAGNQVTLHVELELVNQGA